MTAIRGVFPLPKTGPSTTGTVEAIALISGGMYIIPSGQWITALGATTVLQWFDPLMTLWRPVALQQGFTDLNSDGTNYRIVNCSGGVQSVTVTTAGSGGVNGIGPSQTGTTVGFTAPAGGAPFTPDAYAIIGGTVPVPTVAQGGSGFLVPPVIACDPPPVGGRQALFTATISAAGVITAINSVDAGAGYTSIPKFYIIPQPKFYQGQGRWPGDVTQTWPAPGLIHSSNVWPGTIYQPNISDPLGAQLVGNALTGTGTLTGIVVTYYGGGYTGANLPTISFAGGSLAGGAAATAIMSYSLIGPTIAMGGSSTSGAPFVTGGGVVTPAPTGIIAPQQAAGTYTDASGNVQLTSPGFGLQKVPVGPTGTAVPNANVGGVTDISYLQAML